ncbi:MULTISPECIES: DUF6783 domain-containing protein [Lachnospiraceae]
MQSIKWGLQIAEMIFQTRAKRKHYKIWSYLGDKNLYL